MMRRDFLRLAEATLTGVFFLQAVRFLYATLYAHLGSANLVALTLQPPTGQPGVVLPGQAQTELLITAAALILPLLSLIIGRAWFGPSLAAIAVAVGRVFMTANGGTLFGVAGAAVVVGGGLLYLALTVVSRPSAWPVGVLLAFAVEGLIRLWGDTADPTWGVAFLQGQTILSLGLFGLALITALSERGYRHTAPPEAAPYGNLTLAGAIGVGGLLYIQLAVLGLPNLLARAAGLDYVAAAPFLAVATLLPLVGTVRAFARSFLGMFDGRYRGWVWFLSIALLLVVGRRFTGLPALIALSAAHFMLCLLWWWAVQPSDGRGTSRIGIMAIVTAAVVLLLSGADFLTYEYAFVRGLREPLASVARAFRDLGLPLAILAALLACLPIVSIRKRLAWRATSPVLSFLALLLTIGGGVAAIGLARPIVQRPPEDPTALRVGTLNLHGGYSLYFGSDLESVAIEIRRSGADILLIQEAETGRLVSGGVDQVAWLARRLNMIAAYYPTTESTQGLAVLSRLPLDSTIGIPLTSRTKATGGQLARLRLPDGRLLDVYNTMLSVLFRGGAIPVEEQERDQAAQIQEMLAFMTRNGSSTNPTILGGTFNHAPKTAAYLFLTQQGFIDPFTDFPVERAVTRRLINEAPARVDYLWLRGLNYVEIGMTPITYSSHDMPVVELAAR